MQHRDQLAPYYPTRIQERKSGAVDRYEARWEVYRRKKEGADVPMCLALGDDYDQQQRNALRISLALNELHGRQAADDEAEAGQLADTLECEAVGGAND